MKEIISGIKKGWKETPNSVKFWNGLILLGLIITGILSLEALSGVLGVMSILSLILFISGMGGEIEFDNHLWIWFTPLMWGLTLFVIILVGIDKLYKKTIVKFNNWLNKK